jgi:pimeloyl-ACP methyl ester carboxylesterase
LTKLKEIESMNDPNIHITRWGATGPKIVLVHGSAQGSSAGCDRHFTAQRRLGERGYQVILPDRPGHGRSPSPGRPDDAEADGAWVAQLLGDGAHLVGHSFGACVALAAAALKPSAVRSLTLIEPAMPKIAMGHPAVLKFGLSIMLATVFSLSAAQSARRFSKIVGIPESMQVAPGSEEAKKIGEGLKTLKLPSKQQLTQWLHTVKKAEIPLLVMTGGWNPAFEALANTVATVGGGSRIVIRSEHHFPQNVSDEFNQLLAKSVDAIEARGSAASQGSADRPYALPDRG